MQHCEAATEPICEDIRPRRSCRGTKSAFGVMSISNPDPVAAVASLRHQEKNATPMQHCRSLQHLRQCCASAFATDADSFGMFILVHGCCGCNNKTPAETCITSATLQHIYKVAAVLRFRIWSFADCFGVFILELGCCGCNNKTANLQHQCSNASHLYSCGKLRNGQTDRQADRWNDGPTDGPNDRQTDRQTD